MYEKIQAHSVLTKILLDDKRHRRKRTGGGDAEKSKAAISFVILESMDEKMQAILSIGLADILVRKVSNIIKVKIDDRKGGKVEKLRIVAR